MTKTEHTENWFSRGKAEADKGISRHERIVGVGFFFAGSVLMILYLATHQIWSTGFFTVRFGAVEMFMLYGSWIAWSITSGLESLLGRRFLSRLFDALGGIIFIAVATVWISNDVARVLMVLYAIVMGIAAIYAPVAYKFIKTKRFNLARKGKLRENEK